jgi:NAD(P)-dependent dehydrogenase (short-subunit alcohol dehydrogenase family)
MTTTLITGANRGIGLAIAGELARLGHRVVLSARRRADAEREAQTLVAAGHRAVALELDLTSPERIDAALAELQRNRIDVDVLINNAGVLSHRKLLELSDDDVAESFAVHVHGPLRLIRALTPGMIARGRGHIVNVSSGWGSFAEGLGGPGAYGLTKAALNALTVRIAKELPPSIKVNAMCPGWVRTRMGGDEADRSPAEGADTAVWLATLPADGPTGRFFRDREPIDW